MPNVGQGSVFGVGEESTWNTAVSRTHWYKCLSCTLKVTAPQADLPYLHQGGADVAEDQYFERVDVAGDVVLLASYEGLGLLLKHAMWATPATTGSGPYTHVYALDETPPTGGLTGEFIRGRPAFSGTQMADIFTGLRISRMQVRVEAGGLAQVTLSLIGAGASRAAAGTPSFGTGHTLPLIHHEAGNFSWNSTNYKVKSLAWSLDNKLARRDELGSLYTADPAAPTGLREVALEVTREWRDDDWHTALTAGTMSTASITFTKGSRTFALACHGARVQEVDSPVSGYGVIQETVRLRGLRVGTDLGFLATIVNTQSDATTAP